MLVLHIRTIGVGRFRILGGGPNSQQAHDVVMTSMRRIDVASTSFRRHVPTRFLINQCQIITILILKSDIIEISRIELREIVLPVPSNQIKIIHLLLFYASTWYICDFFPVSHRNRRKRRVDYWGGGGGGPKSMLAPPPKLLGGGACPPPSPPPPLPTLMCTLIFLFQNLQNLFVELNCFVYTCIYFCTATLMYLPIVCEIFFDLTICIKIMIQSIERFLLLNFPLKLTLVGSCCKVLSCCYSILLLTFHTVPPPRPPSHFSGTYLWPYYGALRSP